MSRPETGCNDIQREHVAWLRHHAALCESFKAELVSSGMASVPRASTTITVLLVSIICPCHCCQVLLQRAIQGGQRELNVDPES